MKPYLIILYLIVLVALGASADGLNTHMQTWGHLLEAIEILGLFSFLIVFKIDRKQFVYALGSYICFRIAGFDLLYNLAAGNEWYYLDGSNWWDLALSRQYPSGLLFGRGIFLILGLAFPFNHLRDG